jgi:hypothetical protein
MTSLETVVQGSPLTNLGSSIADNFPSLTTSSLLSLKPDHLILYLVHQGHA